MQPFSCCFILCLGWTIAIFGKSSVLTQFLKSFDVILGFPLIDELLLAHSAAFYQQLLSSNIWPVALPLQRF